MKQHTRDHIIEVASDLFYEKGYNLTGINEIIAKSGIAKATLYSHFRSKEELLMAYLVAKDEELMKSISAFCESRPVGDHQLVAVLEFLLAFFNRADFNGCWCLRTLTEVPRENERVRRQIRAGKKSLQDYMQQLVGLNKPELSADRQQELASQLYLLYEGAVAESHLQDSEWPIRTSIELLKTRLHQVSLA